ncbi:MAG TPA: DUF2076 family protein [Telluria sp.]
MNQQEKKVLQDFLYQLDQARGVVKDPEADEMIAIAVAQQPDAPYLLVQRALLLEQALNNAKEEISALQNQVRRGGQGSSSFLDPNAWGNSGVGRAAAAPQPAPYANVPYQTPPQAMAPGGGGGFMRGGMGGMGGLLGTAAATAAGVAGGAFLFHGIGNLLGNQHEGNQHEGNGLFGQQDEASAHNAFPGLTRPGESDAGNSSRDESALSSDTSSSPEDQDGEFFDDLGGDDSLFS